MPLTMNGCRTVFRWHNFLVILIVMKFSAEFSESGLCTFRVEQRRVARVPAHRGKGMNTANQAQAGDIKRAF